MFSPEELGRALRLLRAHHKMTLGMVSSRAKLTQTMLSSYERGQRLPSVPSLAAILGALNEDLGRLQEALAAVRDRPALVGVPIKWEYLGQALRFLRAQRKRTQSAVARDANLTKAMLTSYETGRRVPSLLSLRAVLKALNCDFQGLQEALLLVLPEGERPQVVGVAQSQRSAKVVEPAPEAGFSFAPEEDGQALIAAFESLRKEGPTVRAILWIERPRTPGGPHPDPRGQEWTITGPG